MSRYDLRRCPAALAYRVHGMLKEMLKAAFELLKFCIVVVTGDTCCCPLTLYTEGKLTSRPSMSRISPEAHVNNDLAMMTYTRSMRCGPRKCRRRSL